MSQNLSKEKEDHEERCRRYRDLLSSLPPVSGCSTSQLYLRNGFYGTVPVLVGTMASQQLFQARDTDILLATFPKSGTTWLKSLIFSTVNNRSSSSDDPSSACNPHQYLPFLESQLYAHDNVPNLESLPSPRLLSTHIPFHSLPSSILDDHSGCRIVYLCRNPKDNFVSLWHFVNKIRASSGEEPIPLDVGFDRFCNGLSMFGPYWDHVLGYWKASLEGKGKVLFMRYEDLKEDPVGELRKLAQFIGFPFTPEEENSGVVEGIVKQCGFENLSSMEVNTVGRTKLVHGELENSMLFRKGVVGDWIKHLTPEMAQRLDQIVENKFQGSGLTM